MSDRNSPGWSTDYLSAHSEMSPESKSVNQAQISALQQHTALKEKALLLPGLLDNRDVGCCREAEE